MKAWRPTTSRQLHATCSQSCATNGQYFRKVNEIFEQEDAEEAEGNLLRDREFPGIRFFVTSEVC